MNPYQPGMTLRVLRTMGLARRGDAWDRTSWLLAKLHNVNCIRAADTVTPAECNPTLKNQRKPNRGQQVDAEFNRAMFEALSE